MRQHATIPLLNIIVLKQPVLCMNNLYLLVLHCLLIEKGNIVFIERAACEMFQVCLLFILKSRFMAHFYRENIVKAKKLIAFLTVSRDLQKS